MAISKRTTNMKPPLGFNVRCVRFFGSGEHSKRVCDAIKAASCVPPAARIVLGYSKKSVSVMASCVAKILQVFCVREKTQIGNPVIGLDAIYMVNFKSIGRKCVVLIQPCKLVSKVHKSEHADPAITICAGSSSNRTSFVTPTIATRSQSRKQTGFFVVMKNVAQSLRCKIVFSHDALQMLIGQRPASVTSVMRASPL